MTTDDLILYIQKQIEKNIDKELIVAKLLQVGWKIEDIEEGFIFVSNKLS